MSAMSDSFERLNVSLATPIKALGTVRVVPWKRCVNQFKLEGPRPYYSTMREAASKRVSGDNLLDISETYGGVKLIVTSRPL